MAEPHARREPDQLRVLVVDDEAPIRLLCRVNLEAEGMVVDETADGQQALDAVSRLGPDVLVLDIGLPDMDGFDVLERLRADEQTAELPVIVLTAVTGESAARRARRYRAMFVAKPFNPVVLPLIVREFVDRR